MDLQNNVVSLRKAQGLNQEALAERLGVTRQTVSNWERGLAEPLGENLVALSKLFGVPAETLVRSSPQTAEQAEQPQPTEQVAQEPEQEEQKEETGRPEQAEQEAATESSQEVPVLHKKRFLRRLAVAGAGIGILVIGLYIGAKFSPNNAPDDVPANALPPDGTYTMDISTEDGDYEIWYEKYRIIRQDEIEPEEIDMSQIEDGSDGWTVIEE